MKKYEIIRNAVLVICCVLTLTAGVLAAGEAGTVDNPLVTLSYLNDTFLPRILSAVDEKLTKRDADLTAKLEAKIEQDKQSLGAAGAQTPAAAQFSLVTLKSGESLHGEVGCEVMLRTGSAVCVAQTTPGLIDSTTGGTIDNGAPLVKNHLYLLTISDRSIKATANSTKLLVRGGYAVS